MVDTTRIILVTGGTGFLGTALVRRLLSAGHRVVLLARSAPTELVSAGARWHKGSVLDARAMREAAAGCDAIVHMAGRVQHTRRLGFAELRELHVTGTVNAVEAAHAVGARRVVHASSSGTVAIGEGPDDIADDDSPYALRLARKWPYYRTKIEAESAALDRGQALDVEVVAMRPSLILGAGDARGSSTGVVADFLARRIPVVPAGGLSFVDVRDAAAAFVAALEHPSPSPSYLLGATNVGFAEFFAQLAALSGVPAPRLRVPYGLLRAATGLLGAVSSDPSLDPVVAEMSRRFWYLDASRAAAELGFAPRDPSETLRETIDAVRGEEAGI